MTNKEVSKILRETADLIKLTGGNEFRARAFSSASRSIDQMEMPLSALADSGSLQDISGIGEGLADDIRDLLENGTFELHNELLEQVPTGLIDVLRVKGLGPSRVRTIWQELGVTSLDELEAAGREDRLRQLSGFGKKTQQNVLEQIELLRHYLKRYLFAEAYRAAEQLIARLLPMDDVRRVELSGDLRRRMEVVDAVELTAAVTAPDAFIERLREMLPEVEIEVRGEEVAVHGQMDGGLPLHLTVSEPPRFGTVLWEQTGSEAHRKQMEERFGEVADVSEEEMVYESVDLPWIAPELREGDGEIDAAEADALPDLIVPDDIRGSIHNHTTYSDGANTVEEMAEAVRAMGHSYLVICDHSRSLNIANGLSIDRVREQQEEIASVNERLSAKCDTEFQIFSGIESDILADGSLDYPDAVLESFDLVVGSVHSRFGMSEGEATDRIVRAVRHPHLRILGHPTGRLLLRREGYAVDHERIIEACGEEGVAIELNANPRRLDLDWRWIRTATEDGVLIAINPDAHSTDELQNVRWGVEVARKGWLRADQCLNTRTLDEFRSWLVS